MASIKACLASTGVPRALALALGAVLEAGGGAGAARGGGGGRVGGGWLPGSPRPDGSGPCADLAASRKLRSSSEAQDATWEERARGHCARALPESGTGCVFLPERRWPGAGAALPSETCLSGRGQARGHGANWTHCREDAPPHSELMHLSHWGPCLWKPGPPLAPKLRATLAPEAGSDQARLLSQGEPGPGRGGRRGRQGALPGPWPPTL